MIVQEREKMEEGRKCKIGGDIVKERDKKYLRLQKKGRMEI